MTASDSNLTTSKRRWYQFSLRTLLVLVLLLSLPLSWLGVKLQQARKKQRAVAELKKLGSVVKVGAADGGLLQQWFGFWCAPVIDIHLKDFPDAGLIHLESLSDLRSLHLENTSVTKVGMLHLKSLPQLDTLHLEGTKVTDTDLSYLAGLPRLQTLHLVDTSVTDAGMVHLRELDELRNLWLRGPGVTDDTLVGLTEVSQLQVLYLNDTRVSNGGLRRLLRAKPELGVGSDLKPSTSSP